MVSSRQTQSQRQTLGFRQIQAVGLLRLTNEGLADHLARRAAANPFLRLRLPAGIVSGGGEVEQADTSGGLYAHVMAQLRLIAAARADEALAIAFVEALDGNGWLDRPVAEIARGAGRPLHRAEAMLVALQAAVEPVGLFARDLADCLRLQAQDRGQMTAAMALVLAHIGLLAEGGAPAVAAATGLPQDEVTTVLATLRRMDPRPGLAFGGGAAPLRAPDVIVSRGAAGWEVALNRSTLPVLSISPAPDASAATRAARTEAAWLATIVERRNRTVLAVARAVLLRQGEFLDHGARALVALRRTEIAAELGLHDSTVGRVARDLLVETPQGLRSLCSLFDSGPRRAGLVPASAAIRHRLAQLVAAENPADPLDDGALTTLLSAEGMALARRTVAKFRQELGIPSRARRRRRQEA
ncbi:hypothetical protein [uncultured Gemmobacter sp.]|jgi:RNA polymerase sigma-54 factor|uniref:RNA polymerase factor sigma-54 n=1 Tax=uncultured Gemmobacter sp. TaxID=1095917 RepID=UPI000AFCC545|nr:hypothetical protein [uncultured Gemmobacter sp.]